MSTTPPAAAQTWVTSRFDIDLSRPRVMGIVNITPDSFSDGGQHDQTRTALAHCEQLLAQGADMLDLGAESTRPGASAVPQALELARLMPVLQQAVRLGVPISVDTYKPEVMRAALDAGADIINDVWALRWRAHGASLSGPEVVREHPRCGLVLMHMHGNPQTMQVRPMTGDVVPEVLSFLKHVTQDLLAQSVQIDRIVWDPGVGFGKALESNYGLLREQSHLLGHGHALLVGWSRKSALAPLGPGGAAQPLPPSQRVAASVAAALLAVQRGASIVRVHDVLETVSALRLLQAVR